MPQRIPDEQLLERLLALSELDPSTGCRLWTGTTNNGPRPYGLWSTGWRRGLGATAHRAAYQLATGERLPPEEDVDHRCRRTLCVEPSHLRRLASADNIALANTTGAEPCEPLEPCPVCGGARKYTAAGHRYCPACHGAASQRRLTRTA